MKIALSSPKFSLRPFEEILPRIAEKFEMWEIVAERFHYLPDIKLKLKELLASYNIDISIHAPLSDINIGSINKNIREQSVKEVINSIEAANFLGAKIVTFHPGHLSPLGIEIPEIVKEYNRKSVKQVSKIGLEFGVKLAIENMPRMLWTTFDSPEELIDAITGTEVKICFDIGHANTSNNIKEFLNYSEFFINVHLHDNFEKPDPHLILGEGNIDFKGILGDLSKKYHGNFVIESKGLENGIKSKTRLDKILLNQNI